MTSRNTLIVYAAIAIVVAAAVIGYVYLQKPGAYQVGIVLKSLNPPGNSYPYQTEFLQAAVKNLGSSNIQGMTVILYLNNTAIDSYQISLATGATELINATYAYATPGNYTFDLVADPAGLFNIQNRQIAHSTVSTTVLTTQSPNPTLYEGLPSNGIESIQSFALQPGGISTAAFVSANYNLSIFNNMVAGSKTVMLGIFNDLVNYIALTNGAYVTYNDSSSIYAAWIQGQITPYAIDQVVSSYGLKIQNYSAGSYSVSQVSLGGNSTLCYYYDSGWTKLIEYNSRNASATCKNIVGNIYNTSISDTLTAALKADSNIQRYQSVFHYVNSTNLGSALTYGNNAVGALNLFVQPKYQILFAGIVRQTPESFNAIQSTSNLTCTGLTYSINGEQRVCATVVLPKTGTIGAQSSLLNSTEITSNYIVSLYSLTNTSALLSAYQSSGQLIQYLNVSGTPYNWGSIYQNKCSLYNASLRCSVSQFNYTTKIATFQITNNFKNRINLNRISCYQPGSETNYTVNQNIASGATIPVNTMCNAFYIPGAFSYITSYGLLLNYSSNGTLKYTEGIVNVTSLQPLASS
jgi:hypothetical protein